MRVAGECRVLIGSGLSSLNQSQWEARQLAAAAVQELSCSRVARLRGPRPAAAGMPSAGRPCHHPVGGGWGPRSEEPETP